MTNFLSDMNEQKRLTDSILLQTNSTVKDATIAIPVIISECNFDKFDSKNIDITVSKVQLSPQTQSAVKNIVHQQMDQLNWKIEKGINREVQSEFSKMLAAYSSSQRVKDMANKLFMANSFQTIKNETL